MLYEEGRGGDSRRTYEEQACDHVETQCGKQGHDDVSENAVAEEGSKGQLALLSGDGAYTLESKEEGRKLAKVDQKLSTLGEEDEEDEPSYRS